MAKTIGYRGYGLLEKTKRSPKVHTHSNKYFQIV